MPPGTAPRWGGAQACVLDTPKYNLGSPFFVLDFLGQYPEVPQVTIHCRGVVLVMKAAGASLLTRFKISCAAPTESD